MRSIINSTYVTLDGVIQNPQNWPVSGGFSDDGGRIQFELLERCDALLMGRHTYDGFAPAWSSRSGDPFSDRMNALPKYVVSTTLTETTPDWTPMTILGSLDEVAALKQGDGGPILVHGSPTLAKALLAAGLVDRYHLLVFPLLLGTGKRLFDAEADFTRLRLVESENYENGIIRAVYDVVS